MGDLGTYWIEATPCAITSLYLDQGKLIVVADVKGVRVPSGERKVRITDPAGKTVLEETTSFDSTEGGSLHQPIRMTPRGTEDG